MAGNSRGETRASGVTVNRRLLTYKSAIQSFMKRVVSRDREVVMPLSATIVYRGASGRDARPYLAVFPTVRSDALELGTGRTRRNRNAPATCYRSLGH